VGTTKKFFSGALRRTGASPPHFQIRFGVTVYMYRSYSKLHRRQGLESAF